MGNITLGRLGSVTWVPEIIIEQELRRAKGDDVKVLLALLHAAQKDLLITGEGLATLCNLSSTQIITACEYWNERGFLTIEAMDASGNMDLTFDESAFQAPKNLKEAPVDTELLHHFQDLCASLESMLGTPLSVSQINYLHDLHNLYGFSDEAILLLFGVGAQKGKGYMDQVAKDWYEAGVVSGDEASAMIRKFEERWNSIRALFRYMGMDPSTIAKPQEEQLSRWLGAYGFNLEMTKLAAKRCITQLGRADLNYIEGILKRWLKLEIKTPQDVAQKDTAPKGAPSKGRRGPAPYEQRTLDYKEIEKSLLTWREDHD
ncbi:hypothetical protein ABB02_00890 [Clostridiaceae bacterium JG1575]|nr:hypothetical protein ABB02_00890 [Clostridiaceae bacterium JG1575]